MKRFLASLIAYFFSASLALAQFQSGGGFGGGGGGGGGGGAGVTSLGWSCPVTTGQTGAVTFPNGVGEIPETSSFVPTASQCGMMFTSTGGAGATLPTIGLSAGDVESPYFVIIKNSDTASNSMSVGGGGTNINLNGASSSSVTLSAGQSAAFVVNAANNLWQATSTAVSSAPATHPGYISGQWYDASVSDVIAAGAAQIASTVYCSLYKIPISVTIKTLGAYFSTGDSGGNVSYAIFNVSNGRPSTLVDYAGPVATPTSAGASSVALHNTTDTLSAGVYFFCETQDNATGIMTVIYTSGIAPGASWAGSASVMTNAGLVAGLTCTAASTCGAGYAAWSAGAFTWASFSNPTWTIAGVGDNQMPVIQMQVN